MNIGTILEFLKKILPMDRIVAWIVGLITAGLCLFMGANSAMVKQNFCASAPVALPSIAAPAVVPAAPAK